MNVGDFQLVDRKIVNKMIKLKDNFPFIRTLAFEYSDNFTTIEYTWKKRKTGKSKEFLKENWEAKSIVNSYLNPDHCILNY